MIFMISSKIQLKIVTEFVNNWSLLSFHSKAMQIPCSTASNPVIFVCTLDLSLDSHVSSSNVSPPIWTRAPNAEDLASTQTLPSLPRTSYSLRAFSFSPTFFNTSSSAHLTPTSWTSLSHSLFKETTIR